MTCGKKFQAGWRAPLALALLCASGAVFAQNARAPAWNFLPQVMSCLLA